MTHEEILARPARVLEQAQREHYFRTGYLGVPGAVGHDWLGPLREVTAGFVEASRDSARDDARFDLEPDHSADAPRIRRLNAPVEQHETFWRFASEGPFADIAEDLLGGDFKFHHSKLNFKWSGGGEEVKWHQDIQFWPHTNYSPLTIGVYLQGVTDEMAPMGVLPGSHNRKLYDLADSDGNWTGALNADDLERIDLDKVV